MISTSPDSQSTRAWCSDPGFPSIARMYDPSGSQALTSGRNGRAGLTVEPSTDSRRGVPSRPSRTASGSTHPRKSESCPAGVRHVPVTPGSSNDPNSYSP
ncbi:MAG: hypothetical protein BWX47_02141 [candidate division Hyd24-12 bacterium ADurb.Bin004]|nr:MAG: hypothetical protein BWX47_02141 [candidate division Hyd24-12 bacterium ADurb.Bin004]